MANDTGAVMINKAMIEILPKFSGQEPVGLIPESDKTSKKKSTKDMLEDWSGTNFHYLFSGSPIEPKYIKAEGKADRMR